MCVYTSLTRGLDGLQFASTTLYQLLLFDLVAGTISPLVAGGAGNTDKSSTNEDTGQLFVM